MRPRPAPAKSALRTAILLPLFAAAALFPATLGAAKVKVRTFPNQGIFAIQVSGTNFSFHGRADHVISASFQEYTTGALYVSEVTIDMQGGNQLLRLYNARPMSEQDARAHAENATAAVSDATSGAVNPTLPNTPAPVSDLDRKVQDNYGRATAGLVVKTYPATTHAKTVEFTVSSRAELLTFYQNFTKLYTAVPLYTDATGKVVAQNQLGANGQAPTPVNRIGGTLFIID